MKLYDYECVTTFWEDFSIAEAFGKEAIADTYRRAFDEWKDNHIYLTELVMVLNHKLWYWYEKQHNHPYVEIYNVYFEQASDYALSTLKGEEMQYYLRVTD